MNIQGILSLIRDELDAQQIVVRLEETNTGVIVHADNYAARVIAKRELRNRGILVREEM